MKEQQKKASTAPFYHYRGVSKCLSAGISFLTDHFLRLLWLILPVTLPLAGVLGALLFVQSDESLFLYSSKGMVWSIVLTVAVFIMFAALLSTLYQLLVVYSREEEWWRLKWRHVYSLDWLKRLGKTLMVIVLQTIVIGFFVWVYVQIDKLPVGENELNISIAKVVGYVVLTVLLLAVMVPSSLCLPAAQLSDVGLFPSVWRGYRMGWRKWNKVFGLDVLTYIIVNVIAALLMSPALIAFFVRKEAVTSLLQGDAVALPSSFSFWAVLLFVVTSFLLCLVQLVGYTPQAYLYASLKSDETASK